MTIATILDTPRRRRLPLPDTEIFRLASRVVEVLREAQFEAYLVGGAIRDTLMGSLPGDCDITTNATPQQVMKLFRRTVPVGIDFGTVMVLIDDHHFEVTTFRADGCYEDGRRPTSVSFSEHVTDDLERRDLTINGLIYAPETQEVLDYTGGLDDLEQRLIRTIGPPWDRFREDRLRMMRAVRFAARLAFQLDSDTFVAIRKLAPHLRDVSIERIQQEMFKILQCPSPARGIQLLYETGLLEQIIPSLPDHNKAVHRLLHFESLAERKEGLALALLLADLEPKQAEEVLRELRFSKELTSFVVEVLDQHHTLSHYLKQPESAQKRFLRQPRLNDILTFSTILQYEDRVPPEAVRQLQYDCRRWDHDDLHPPRLLNGHRLRQMGFSPGPDFRTILLAVEDEQLQGNLHTAEQAETWVLEHFPNPRQPDA